MRKPWHTRSIIGPHCTAAPGVALAGELIPHLNWSIVMRHLFTGTLAAGFLLAATPSFAQTPIPTPTPTVHGNMDKSQDHAENTAKWHDCMSRMGAHDKGTGKSAGQHKGNGHTAATNKTTGKTQPNYEPKNEGKNEAPEAKMNHHEEMMQDCRNQLYGGNHGEPGGKESGNTQK